MTGTPSKDRAGTRHAAYEILCRIDAPTDDKRIGIVAAALATSFAEGTKRAAEIARDELVEIYDDSPDIDIECNNLVRRILDCIEQEAF